MRRMNKKCKILDRFGRLLFMLAGIVVFGIICSMDNVQAGVQNRQEPRQNTIANVNFENGGFEEPLHVDVKGKPDEYGNAEYPVIWNDWSIVLHMDFVPEWETYPTDENAHHDHPQKHYIEIEQSLGSTLLNRPDAKEGSQYAELNALVPGTLYQICNTNPGQKVYWEFYHRGREGVDTMDFYLFNSETETTDDVNYIIRATDDNTSWKYYSGTYLVPDGQTSTTFAFQAVDAQGGNTMGNFLDGINFFNPSFLELTKTVTTPGTSEGVSFALPDVLPDGIELDQSSIRMTYTDKDGNVQSIDTTGLITFDAGTDLLTIEAGLLIQNATMYNGQTGEQEDNHYANGTRSIGDGEKVTIIFDALVTGDQVAAGDVIWNQAKVVYNDLGFEQYSKNEFGETQDDYNYSNIAEFELWEPVALEIEKEIDQLSNKDQSFVFKLEYQMDTGSPVTKTFYSTVTVEANQPWSTVLLENLYPGHYTITELNSNWKCQIDLEQNRRREKTLDVNSVYNLQIFSNKYTEKAWIHGADNIENNMKELPAPIG